MKSRSRRSGSVRSRSGFWSGAPVEWRASCSRFRVMQSDERETSERVRLDKWLWAARFFKTRALAAEAIDGGKVEVNDARAKRAKMVQLGDEVRVRQTPFEHVVIVRGIA